MVLLLYDPSWEERQSIAEDRDARVRVERRPDRIRLPRAELVGCRIAHWSCRCRASGFFCQLVQLEFGYFPRAGCGFRRWDWRHGRSHRRDADGEDCGLRLAVDR